MRKLFARLFFLGKSLSLWRLPWECSLMFIALLVSVERSSIAQTWTTLSNGTPFQASQPLLLTDGSVLCQEYFTNNWYKLKPDQFGNYVNGTWTQVASMQPDYGPLYYASAVLADGRVVVTGGEYNAFGSGFTNKGATYNPVTNTWNTLAPPTGWANIGDAQCVVLPTGEFILADPLSKRMAKLNPQTLTWTALAGTGKSDPFDEEGWTLLPNGTVLTVDAVTRPNSELYLPGLDKWISAGSTVVDLVDPGGSEEIGPSVLRPDGMVFYFGGSQHNSVYNSNTGVWTPAPDFPLNSNGQQLDMADAPACLLPSGNILCMTSPGVFATPVSFYEVSYTNNQFIKVPDTPDAPFLTSFEGRMLLLPTGQVLLTDGSGDVEIYTPTGTFNPAWRPTISNSPAVVNAGQSYPISGTQFNGLSQASTYGDDAGQATNYPLVRITNNDSGHVFYCRTFGHSTMGVATGATPVSTNFAVPKTAEGGDSILEVVANGIPSAPVPITVIEAPFIDSIEFNPDGQDIVWVPATTIKGGGIIKARVNLSNPAPEGGAIVQLATEDPNVATVTPSITVQGSRISQTFYVFSIPVQGTETVLVSATAKASTAVAPLTVQAPLPTALTIIPATVTGGNTASGAVYVDSPAPSSGLPITLTSSKSQYASVAPTVTIPPSKTYATFPIKTFSVTQNQTSQISASNEGVTVKATINVAPVAGTSLTSLAFNPSTVPGGTALKGSITLTRPAPTGGVTIALSKTDPGGAVVLPTPASVYIPAGVQTMTFALQTNVVAVDANATITATYNSASKSAAVKVRAPYLTSLTILPTSVRVNTTATGRAFLSGPALSAVTVTLVPSAGVTCPTSVIIPKGSTNATFNVTATATGTQTVTGTYPAGTSAAGSLLVLP